MTTIIKAENISKQYRLGYVGSGSIKDDVKRWWYGIRGKDDPLLKIGDSNDRTQKGESDYVWALKDINFEIQQGDTVGIIGRNGAGKSTLLKLLSKVTAPTTGNIKVKGRIASLLEVGTGFHGELTGRENIYLNGAIMGMRKHEITRRLDEIVDFAGVERYLDTPVKRYSSGMYVRLGFAVAAHLENEILIVDEVLAVGDAEFQKKCLGKMGDVAKGEGRTVLFVSHNMGSVRSLCRSAVLLLNGKVVSLGKVDQIVDQYNNIHNKMINLKSWFAADLQLNLAAQIIGVEITLNEIKNEYVLVINTEIVSNKKHDPLFIAYDIISSDGTPILQSIPSEKAFIEYKTSSTIISSNLFLPRLIPGVYLLSVWIGEHYTKTIDWRKEIVCFEIENSPQLGRIFPHSTTNGYQICVSTYKFL